MNEKTLHDACAETGATRRAVQGYEKAGLVCAARKNKYGYLLYDEAGTERIRTIRFFQKIGFSLKEIRSLIDAPADRQKAVLRAQMEKLRAHREEVSGLIGKIEAYIAKL